MAEREPILDVDGLTVVFTDETGEVRLDLTIGVGTRIAVCRLHGCLLGGFGAGPARLRSTSDDSAELTATIGLDGGDAIGGGERAFEVMIDIRLANPERRDAIGVSGSVALVDLQTLSLIQLQPVDALSLGQGDRAPSPRCEPSGLPVGMRSPLLTSPARLDPMPPPADGRPPVPTPRPGPVSHG